MAPVGKFPIRRQDDFVFLELFCSDDESLMRDHLQLVPP